MKIVINKCYGGFGLSREAFLELRKMGNEVALREADHGEYWSDGSGPRKDAWASSFCNDIARDSKQLVDVVERLGKDANGPQSELRIIEIPDGIDWEIGEYDGVEWVAEKHRRWS